MEDAMEKGRGATNAAPASCPAREETTDAGVGKPLTAAIVALVRLWSRGTRTQAERAALMEAVAWAML